MSLICPICNLNNYKSLMFAPGFDNPKEEYEIIECLNCSTVITMPLFEENDLNKFYQKEYYGTNQKKFVQPIEYITILLNKLLSHKIHNYLKKNKNNQNCKILDIGCGRGTLLSHLKEKNYECYGIERDGIFAAELRNGIHFLNGSLMNQNFEDNYFDCIVIWHVLEHIINPDLVMKQIFKILKPGGHLWIAVPNFKSFQSKLFKKHWFHLDLPRHRFHYSLTSLKYLLKSYDYNVENISTFSLEQNIYGFIQSSMNMFSYYEQPELFYEMLKKNKNHNIIPIIKGLISSCVYFIFAVLELIISVSFKKGAVIILHIKKNS